jgi:hypothetical protein
MRRAEIGVASLGHRRQLKGRHGQFLSSGPQRSIAFPSRLFKIKIITGYFVVRYKGESRK